MDPGLMNTKFDLLNENEKLFKSNMNLKNKLEIALSVLKAVLHETDMNLAREHIVQGLKKLE